MSPECGCKLNDRINFLDPEFRLEEGKLVTHTAEEEYSLTHTGEELTEGRHYWEVELIDRYPHVVVCRPDADSRTDHALAEATTAWLMYTFGGGLYGNGKEDDNEAGEFDKGDRVGVLLDLDDGSLRFFKNGVEHGPGYPAGSVAGPVALAAQLYYNDDEGLNAVRLLPGAEWPAGHAP